MIKKFNISRPKKYFKDNVEKTMWQNVGVMTEFIKDNGEISRKIEIPAIGLDAQVFPFEDKKEGGYATRPAPKPMTPDEEYNAMTPANEEEVINPADIPY